MKAILLLAMTTAVMLAILLSSGAQMPAGPIGSAAATVSTPAPRQPIPFSHKDHASTQIPCEYCHVASNETGDMGLPATSLCMACHDTIAADKAPIQMLAKYSRENQPVPWVQVYSVPALAFFSHVTHGDAKIGCAACHGDVAQMDAVRKVTNVTSMAGCVACHTAKSAPTGCLVCHDLPNAGLSGISVPHHGT